MGLSRTDSIPVAVQCQTCKSSLTMSTRSRNRNLRANGGKFICKSCRCRISGTTEKPALRTIIIDGSKACYTCNVVKKLHEFTKKLDGVSSSCKECRKKHRKPNKDYWNGDPEVAAKKAKKWLHEAALLNAKLAEP